MHILVAYDGSASAEQALHLAARMRLPPQSRIDILSVIEPTILPPPLPVRPGSDELVLKPDPFEVAQREALLARIVERIERPDRAVRATVLEGRPGSVLIDAAAASRPDLTIVGARGQSPIVALVLGSVSAEVVDHAPTPVLVARSESISRAVFATDGSDHTVAAETVLAHWPVFEDVPVQVVSVAEPASPWNPALAPTMPIQVAEHYTHHLEAATAEHLRVATQAAERLRAAGRMADAISPRGDAAGTVITESVRLGADIIVVGSRGRRGAMRFVLGSVARNILYGSTTSVLVVRGTVDV